MDRTHLLTANLPVISAALGVTFFCLWLGQKGRRHVLDWSLSYACGFLGSGIGLARLVQDDTAWFSFFGNAFLVGMAYFGARGVIFRHSGRNLDHLLLLIYAATVAAGLWYGFAEPSVFGRGTATSLGAAAIILVAMRVMWKADTADRVDTLTVVAFGVTAVMLAGRPAVVYFLEGAGHGEADVTGSWWGVSFRILATLSWISIAILFFHRITSDLLSDLRTQSRTDPLTGILNRRGFFSQAGDVAPEGAIAVILCDIDEFKKVNDTYGHTVGDTVLQDFVAVLKQAADASGCIIGRLGGEEFVGLLPNTDIVDARAFAERIRAEFAAAPHKGLPASHVVTVSIGVAVAFGNETLETVLNQADQALYRAKVKGRNCVEFSGMALPDPSMRRTEIRQRRGTLA